MTLAIRLAIAAVTALSFAAVPIYPGATLDAAASKEINPTAALTAPGFYEKVVAFYKAKGAAQSDAISGGNTAQQKMAMFSASDSTIAINWPADVKDKTGKVVSKTGTRIAIGS